MLARYRLRPPLREISLLTLEGARPIVAAMVRSESPAAIPLETSSRSSQLSERLERRRGSGAMPPCAPIAP
jgi:hypothetical protein